MGDHDPRWLTGVAGQDIRKVPFIDVSHQHAPEAVQQVVFCRQNGLFCRYGHHETEEAGQDPSDFLNGVVWRQFTDGASGGGGSQWRRPRLLAGRAAWTGNDRSRSNRLRRPTWGMTAKGEIFEFTGSLLRRLCHNTTSEKPAAV